MLPRHPYATSTRGAGRGRGRSADQSGTCDAAATSGAGESWAQLAAPVRRCPGRTRCHPIRGCVGSCVGAAPAAPRSALPRPPRPPGGTRRRARWHRRSRRGPTRDLATARAFEGHDVRAPAWAGRARTPYAPLPRTPNRSPTRTRRRARRAASTAMGADHRQHARTTPGLNWMWHQLSRTPAIWRPQPLPRRPTPRRGGRASRLAILRTATAPAASGARQERVDPGEIRARLRLGEALPD